MGGFRRLLTWGLVLAASGAHAFYLDKGRNFDVRLRTYSQIGIMTERSEEDMTVPVGIYRRRIPTKAQPWNPGDIGQNRFFYNPELDARLTDYTRWLGNPDEVKFRFAWWGFYDGLYDYTPGPFGDNMRAMQGRFAQSSNYETESFTFTDERKRPRRIYASRNRINELYLDYTKGPVFMRVGRQSISWGESDSVALHDVQNPFDLTMAAPGLFQDTDEARIPLYTVRSTVKLIESWKFLSSTFVDAYLVPGPIDTTVPINPITAGGISPFVPQQADPQAIIGNQRIPYPKLFGPNQAALHATLVDELPKNTWSNSRWGVRLAGILFGDYTTQVWFYRTFNQQPVLQIISPGSPARAVREKDRLDPTLIDNRGFRTPVCNGIDETTGSPGRTPAGRPCNLALPQVQLLRRRLESVIGVATSWYSEPLNGIIRAQAQFFNDELAFVPQKNANPRVAVPPLPGLPATKNVATTADYLRWVIAYDRFFFFKPLNPTNSFTAILSYNSEFNLSEKGGLDYRWPNTKPNRPSGGASNGPVKGVSGCTPGNSRNNPLCIRVNPHDFYDRYQYEGFFQAALQTDYMFGKLQPRLTMILDISGVYAFVPSLQYRVNDNFLLGANWVVIEGRRAGIGTFRASDMVQVRATFQIN